MSRTNIVVVSSGSFEYVLRGIEGRSIVFINGFRIPMSNWGKLFPDVEKCGRVLTYNRAGVGRTGKASCIQTGEIVINSLREILKALNVSSPYVLVAHSLGGLFANLFARMWPEEVCSVVFVDAAHPDERELQSKFQPPYLINKINEGVKSIERIFDKYKYSEDEHIDKTIQEITQAGKFPQIPIAVVSGTKKMPLVPEESFTIHLQCQKKLLALSPDSRQYVAANSGHFPHITDPAVVLSAVNDIVSTSNID